MIRINLLPAREARRRVELRHQLQLAVVVLFAALGGGAWGYMAQQNELAARQQELAGIEEEIKRLEAVIKEVQKFETQKSVMEKKVSAIEDIKLKQRRPARVLDEISRNLPDQMWLTSIKDAGGGLQIVGKSFDNVGIAAFMENLERSPAFGSVELIESKSELLQGRQVVTFTVVARLGSPGE
ncbi:MAG: hypothetical protein FJZ47_13565 [Candidatus Tectomicrobia bacterium]|uniref:Fimbrial protein n=1 Tax=Tectimicrobiota bacterium TaxID=2528274 RepID=A0A937W473_UNCTE|nr:hypothetical protein [Candidatus Tectomicrobia bacterium]